MRMLTCDEAGAGEGGGLGEDCLAGPDVSGGHKAAALARGGGRPDRETLGVGAVQPQTRLTTKRGHAAPGALNSHRFEF